jgi:RNA polymerase sigma-70 factor (ECF subfamily)
MPDSCKNAGLPRVFPGVIDCAIVADAPGVDDDLALVRDCLGGAPRAWDTFARTFRPFLEPVVRAVFLRSLGSAPEADVDNALQDLFTRLLEDSQRRLRSFQGRCPFRLWLRSVAVRHVLTHVRDEKLRGRWGGGSIDDLPLAAPEEAPEDRDEARRLRRLLDELPPLPRTALKMFYFDGLPYRRIASLLGVRVQTLGSILTRARETLRDRLRCRDE